MRGHLIYVPYELATTPADGHCYVNRWWVVHPQKGVLWYISVLRPTIEGEENSPSPQCNSNELITINLRDRIYPDCGVLLIPVVYDNHAVKEQRRMHMEQQNKRRKSWRK